MIELGEEIDGATEEVRRCRHVPARERAPSCGCEPRRTVGAERPPVVVQRAEVGEVAVRLLEVVAEDLLVLGRTLAVDAVRPLDELLVEGRASALEDPFVSRVANEDVMEAERLFLGRPSRVGQHELLARQRFQMLLDPRAGALRHEMAHAHP